jgi:adenosine deaminase
MIDPKLPLIDLHRHLDGSVRLATVLELAERHGIALPGRTAEELAPHVRIDGAAPGVMAFIARFRWLLEVMVDADACRRIAYENVEDAKREGIDHLELRFSPWFMAERHGLDPAAVVEAVADGVAAGRRDFGVSTGLIGILSRTYGPETARRERASSRSTSRATRRTCRRHSSSSTSAARATRAGASPCTRARPRGRKACGARSATSARRASATVSARARTWR